MKGRVGGGRWGTRARQLERIRGAVHWELRTYGKARQNERQTARLNDGEAAERQAGGHGGEAGSIEQGYRDR